MGIVVVLAMYAVVLLVAATALAGVLWGATYLALRRTVAGRRRAMLVALGLPFSFLLFAGVWFAGYATINTVVMHRDPGLGDSWQTPLPNGYALNMIDVTDHGTVFNPRTQTGGAIVSQGDAAFGVRQLQVAGSHIYGAADSAYMDHMSQATHPVDSWFALDTGSGRRTDFHHPEELRRAAEADGVSLQLQEFEQVFGKYRTTWFDYLAGALLLLVPLAALGWFVRWVVRLRRAGPLAAAS